VSDIILESLNIRKGFGGVVALDNLTFLIARNTITAIIGPNGAGKTTLLNVVSGMHAPDRGTIFLNQKTISGLKPHEITRCGLARTFQTAQIFGNMTVLENVMVGKTTYEAQLVGVKELSEKEYYYCYSIPQLTIGKKAIKVNLLTRIWSKTHKITVKIS